MPSTLQDNIKNLQQRRTEVLKQIADLTRAKELSAKKELNQIQKHRARLLLDRLKQLDKQIESLNAIDKKVQAVTSRPVTPVARAAVGSTPMPAAVQTEMSDLERRLDAIRPGSQPLPKPVQKLAAAPKRTIAERRALLAKDISDKIFRKLHGDHNRQARHTQEAIVAYLKYGLFADARSSLNRSAELGLITSVEKLSMLYRVQELCVLTEAQLKVMQAVEQTDPTIRSMINQQAIDIIEQSGLDATQKQRIHGMLKSWVNDEQVKKHVIFKGPLPPVDPRIAEALGPAPKFDGVLFRKQLEAARMQEMVAEFRHERPQAMKVR